MPKAVGQFTLNAPVELVGGVIVSIVNVLGTVVEAVENAVTVGFAKPNPDDGTFLVHLGPRSWTFPETLPAAGDEVRVELHAADQGEDWVIVTTPDGMAFPVPNGLIEKP